MCLSDRHSVFCKMISLRRRYIGANKGFSGCRTGTYFGIVCTIADKFFIKYSLFHSLFSASLDSHQLSDVTSSVTGTQGYQVKTVPVVAAIVSHICRQSRPSRLRGGSFRFDGDRGILGYHRLRPSRFPSRYMSGRTSIKCQLCSDLLYSLIVFGNEFTFKIAFSGTQKFRREKKHP